MTWDAKPYVLWRYVLFKRKFTGKTGVIFRFCFFFSFFVAFTLKRRIQQSSKLIKLNHKTPHNYMQSSNSTEIFIDDIEMRLFTAITFFPSFPSNMECDMANYTVSAEHFRDLQISIVVDTFWMDICQFTDQ